MRIYRCNFCKKENVLMPIKITCSFGSSFDMIEDLDNDIHFCSDTCMFNFVQKYWKPEHEPEPENRPLKGNSNGTHKGSYLRSDVHSAVTLLKNSLSLVSILERRKGMSWTYIELDSAIEAVNEAFEDAIEDEISI